MLGAVFRAGFSHVFRQSCCLLSRTGPGVQSEDIYFALRFAIPARDAVTSTYGDYFFPLREC